MPLNKKSTLNIIYFTRIGDKMIKRRAKKKQSIILLILMLIGILALVSLLIINSYD